MTEEKVLSMWFQTEGGKTAKMTLRHPKDNLEEGTVRGAMQNIVTTEGLKFKTGKAEKPLAAFYITRSTSQIFSELD